MREKIVVQDMGFNDKNIRRLQESLIRWYEENHRKLPWRETKDPYKIWISEVMLQQTRVDTVIPYYLNFIDKFPNVDALAEAQEGEVLKAWEGLGYYSRARNLQRGAKKIVGDYHGEMPQTLEEVLKIPGIGLYTAGAVLSIAFDQPVPAVDGNVMRVFSRIFHIREDIGEAKTKKKMEGLGKLVIPLEKPSQFNQGLMELGALICTPTNPRCLSCPIAEECEARLLGTQYTLPVKKKKTKVKEVALEVALLWKGNKVLLTKRSHEGLLAGLWAFPSVVREGHQRKGTSIVHALEADYGMQVKDLAYKVEEQHVFTHLKWNMEAYGLELIKETPIDYPEVCWVTFEEISEYAVPTAFMKIINKVKKDREHFITKNMQK